MNRKTIRSLPLASDLKWVSGRANRGVRMNKRRQNIQDFVKMNVENEG